MISRSGTRKSSDMISRSVTRKSSDANMLAVSKIFDFAQWSAGFSEVFRLPLRKMSSQQLFWNGCLLEEIR